MTWLELAIFLLTIASLDGACPWQEVMRPCACVRDEYPSYNVYYISCGDLSKNLNLAATFKKISAALKPNEKHFSKLEIRNSYLTEIGPDATADITFSKIEIQGWEKLKKIHRDAFKGTVGKLKTLKIENMAIYQRLPKPYDIFDFLNTLVNVEEINLWIPRINRLPKEALKLPKLKRLYIGYNFQDSVRLTIEDRAFYNLDQLTFLSLSNNRINFLPKNAFQFKKESASQLSLKLHNNQLNSTSFANNWLNNINRPVSLLLESNNIKVLDKKQFKTFLDKNNKNEIQIPDNPLSCSDCQNAWLAKEKSKYQDKVRYAYCDKKPYGTPIFDGKYSNCK